MRVTDSTRFSHLLVLRLLCFRNQNSYLRRRPDLPAAAHAEFATSAISNIVAEAAVAAADAAVAAADAALAAAALPAAQPKQHQHQLQQQQQHVHSEQSVEELLLNLKHAQSYDADYSTAAVPTRSSSTSSSSSSTQKSSAKRAVKQQQPKRKRVIKDRAPPAPVPELPVATNRLGWPMTVSTKRQRANYGV
jgi:Mg-chelatase subunit ChlI